MLSRTTIEHLLADAPKGDLCTIILNGAPGVTWIDEDNRDVDTRIPIPMEVVQGMAMWRQLAETAVDVLDENRRLQAEVEALRARARSTLQEDAEIRIPSADWINTPSMIRDILGGRLPLDASATVAACKVHMLTTLLPALPGGVVQDLVSGERPYRVEGGTVVILPRMPQPDAQDADTVMDTSA